MFGLYLTKMADEEAEAVRDQTLSDGYSASEPLDGSDQAQRHDQTEVRAWEEGAYQDSAMQR